MKSIIINLLLLVTTYHAGSFAQYILCIDGGGSKTALQIIDDRGHVVELIKKDTVTNKIESTGSNINTLGQERVKESLFNLFNDARINNSKKIEDILKDSYVIAGMAGVGNVSNKNGMIKIFEDLGIEHARLLLTSDAQLALQLIPGDGAILIAGTGSICLGKKKWSIISFWRIRSSFG